MNLPINYERISKRKKIFEFAFIPNPSNH